MERWKALAVFAVAGALLHFFGTNIADPDIWGHLRYGTSMWQGGGLPWVDTYSYTASGAVFYDHEWLSDFFFAGLWWAAGSPGLIVAKLFFGLLIVVLLRDAGATLGRTWYPKFRAHPLPEALVLVLALSVIAPGATFRPQLWTMLLLAAQLAVLARAEARLRGTAYRGRVGWEAGVQPLLIAFWANLHGGFLVGVAVFGLFVGSVLVRALCGLFPARLRPREGLAVAGLGLFALAAPVLNPYGTDLYAYLWRTLGDHGAMGEWNAVALGDPNFFRFQALVLLTLSGAFFLARRRRLPIAELAMGWWLPLLALLAVYSYRHQRHTVLFAEAAVPFLLVSGDRARCLLLRRWPVLRPTPLLRRAVFCALVLIAGMQIGGFSRTLARDGATIRFDRFEYPVDAVQFLHENGLRGNIAMPFEWGAYANWKLGEEFQVFIDGRYEAVFPPRVIDDYFRFTEGAPGWERLLDAYPTEIIVVQRWRNIHPRLFARDDLRYVYSDPAALVFVRFSPTNAAALDRLTRIADARLEFDKLDTVFP
jgi:hypothetical protein